MFVHIGSGVVRKPTSALIFESGARCCCLFRPLFFCFIIVSWSSFPLQYRPFLPRSYFHPVVRQLCLIYLFRAY
ncbi:hypothetical protein BDN72DRAFT_129195 [Pluteus cervinus]|uniref:Uncharacterized protein n=1 Tax=Pluteus cervinus TaxID=181527 RepID=A0ACD3AMQ3_9AGAR|nr:hypothetical protein BDN72DRAFT_129195 [Pluteus cervinus]